MMTQTTLMGGLGRPDESRRGVVFDFKSIVLPPARKPKAAKVQVGLTACERMMIVDIATDSHAYGDPKGRGTWQSSVCRGKVQTMTLADLIEKKIVWRKGWGRATRVGLTPKGLRAYAYERPEEKRKVVRRKPTTKAATPANKRRTK